MWSVLLATAFAAPPPAVVSDAPPAIGAGGEAVRLSAELGTLASKSAWLGVERTFQKIVATGVAPRFEDWVWAAEAARARGDITLARERFNEAVALREDRAIIDTLWDLDTRFGSVHLACDPGSYVQLVPDQVPFDPDLLRAIEFARREVHDRCEFEGLLPAGTYRLFDAPIDVQARSDVRVDLRGRRIPRSTRKELKATWLAESAPPDEPTR